MRAAWPRQNGKNSFRDLFMQGYGLVGGVDPTPRSFVFEGHAIESLDLEQAGDAHGRLTVQLKPGY